MHCRHENREVAFVGGIDLTSLGGDSTRASVPSGKPSAGRRPTPLTGPAVADISAPSPPADRRLPARRSRRRRFRRPAETLRCRSLAPCPKRFSTTAVRLRCRALRRQPNPSASSKRVRYRLNSGAISTPTESPAQFHRAVPNVHERGSSSVARGFCPPTPGARTCLWSGAGGAKRCSLAQDSLTSAKGGNESRSAQTTRI
jgi:hypothetical protein